MKNIKTTVIATAAALLLPLAAQATTVTTGPGGFDNGYATSITYDDAALRGSTFNRDNPLNALGADDGAFFELGFGSFADFTFGTAFDGDATIVEVTFGSRAGFPESVDVFVMMSPGAFVFAGSISNALQSTTVSLAGLGGPFDTLRIVDTTDILALEAATGQTQTTGGFDIDAVRVSPVPLPAAGLMLLAAVGGMAAMRRRKS